MGAAHSRARPGAGPSKISHVKTEGNVKANQFGYFILCIKGCDRIKVVNASNPVLKMITAVIKKHFSIIKSGWDRHLAFSFKLQKSSKHSLIAVTAEVLLTLYRNGWEPLTPIDLSVKDKNQTAICFRRETPEQPPTSRTASNLAAASATPVSGSFDDVMLAEHKECLCLETSGQNVLGFHEVPNMVLLDLVQCVRHEWQSGIQGMSSAVSSVISDYVPPDQLPPVLPDLPTLDDRRFIRLRGRPWSKGEEGAELEDAICAENLVISIVACLARAQYKLQISIQMDMTTTLFFFIKDPSCKDVRLPTFCGVGLGEKDGLYVYKPTIVRTKTSFFRNRFVVIIIIMVVRDVHSSRL